MQELDPRLIKLGVQIGSALKTYEGLLIHATGTKYGNSNQNECTVQIANMDEATRDYILTETSPFNKNRKPKKLILDVGRVSYGTSRLFIGDITSSGISQPPDITLTMKALTGNFVKGDTISRNKPAQASLRSIAEQAAKDTGTSLNFQAKDKNIANYSFSGGALKQVNEIGRMGNVDAYIDDETLVVKESGVALTGQLRKLNLSSGMIGIPELTEVGIKVTFLFDNQTSVGSALEITSELNPSLNGTYVIYKLSFDVSNRDTPFYYIAEATRL